MNETKDYSKFWFCGCINQPRVILTGKSLASYTIHQAQSEQSPSFASSRRPYASHDGRRKWKSGKTKASKGTTIALRVRFTAFYSFWPSFAKQQRKITKFFVVWKRQTRRRNIQVSFSVFNAAYKFFAEAASGSSTTGAIIVLRENLLIAQNAYCSRDIYFQ